MLVVFWGNSVHTTGGHSYLVACFALQDTSLRIFAAFVQRCLVSANSRLGHEMFVEDGVINPCTINR